MLLTLKNKTCLAMDGLIKEAKDKGGVPASFKITTQEGVEFLQEITEMNAEDRRNIVIKQKDENETDTRFLLKPPLLVEMAQFLIKKWNKKEIEIFYKDVEVIIFNKAPGKSMLPKPPPPPPPNRIIRVGDGGEKCKACGSSMHRKFFFWTDGCIQPQCKNYYAGFIEPSDMVI